jgi:ATP-dependent helicase HrpA
MVAKLNQKRGGGTPPRAEDGAAFRWLVEEFRVSLFAQELGTAEPVSAVKLDRWLASGGKVAANAVTAKVETKAVTPTPAVPMATVKTPDKKSGPLKNFGALDKFIQR